MSERMPTNYNKITDLTYIESEDLLSIELNAKVLELDECFDLLFIDKDELSEREFTFCKKAHRRGRKSALSNAGKYLFAQMQARNGTAACLEYLKAHSATFQMEITPDPSAQGGFQFNVFMPDDDKDSKANT